MRGVSTKESICAVHHANIRCIDLFRRLPYSLVSLMDKITLKGKAIPDKVSAKHVRKAGAVPCIVYGNEVKNMAIHCDLVPLHKAFAKAGESTLVELDIDGKTLPVLFKAVSFHPVSGREIHVDFYAVNMKKEIEAEVPVRFEGEAPACKELGAIFVASHNHVRVRSLPRDLPVNIAKLVAFHDSVTVADLTVPKGVTVMDAKDMVLAIVQEPRAVEEIAPPTPTAEEVAAAAAATEGEPPKAGGVIPGNPEGAGAPAKEAKVEEKKAGKK